MRKTSLFVLFLIVFIDLLGFGMVIPLLPYYADHFGAKGTTVGLIVGIYSFMQFFFAPVWGRLSDRIGRRPVLLISLTGSCAGYTIFAFATNLPLLFASRIVAGIAAANIGTAQAYVADTTTAETRAKGMGLIGAAFGIGFVFGPPLGGILSSVGMHHGFHGNFLPGVAAALFSITALSVAVTKLAESKPADLTPRSGRPPQFDPSIWRMVVERPMLTTVLFSLFLVILAFAGMETSVVLYGKDRFGFSPRDLGWFFGLMGVTVATIQGGMIGRLASRFGERNLVLFGTICLATGFGLVPAIGRPGPLYAVAILIAIGQGLCYPSLTSLVTKNAPTTQQGSILGISSAMSSFARMTGPVLAGWLYDLWVGGGPFFASSTMTVLAFLLMASFVKQPAAEPKAGEQTAG